MLVLQTKTSKKNLCREPYEYVVNGAAVFGGDQFLFEIPQIVLNICMSSSWFCRNTMKYFQCVFSIFEKITLSSIDITQKQVLCIYGLMSELVKTVKTLDYSHKMLVHLHLTISPDLKSSFNRWSMFYDYRFCIPSTTKTF